MKRTWLVLALLVAGLATPASGQAPVKVKMSRLAFPSLVTRMW